MGAHPLTGSHRPSRAFKAGRICRHPGCGTMLSIYNDGKFCYQHEPMVVPRMRGKKIACLTIVSLLGVLAVFFGYLRKAVAAKYPKQ